MHIAIEFLTAVERDPELRARMESADGDLEQIVAIAAAAGYEMTAEQFMRGYEALVDQSAASGAPGHPIVYFQENAAHGHPAVYFQESAAHGHPAVYFQENAAHGHPAVYFQESAAPAQRAA